MESEIRVSDLGLKLSIHETFISYLSLEAC